jgi:hypothetical protein
VFYSSIPNFIPLSDFGSWGNQSQLEDSLQASEQDLKYASTTLQADLDRFQRQKVADLRQMAIQLSKVHREWCKQVSIAPLFLKPLAKNMTNLGIVESRSMASCSKCDSTD